MIAQLAIDFDPVTDEVREPFPLPADHPVNALPLSPWAGPDAWPGFESYCDQLDAATIAECVRVFNKIGGAQIRWDATLHEFVTTDGDRYPRGSVEDVVRGILKGRS